MIIEQKESTVINSKSPLQFSLPKTSSVYGDAWFRYLTIDGKNIFNTGNICGTCCCYFEYLPGDKKDNFAIAQEFSAALNAGINSLDSKILQQAEMLIPDGDYFVLLSTIKPKEVVFGDDNDYFSNEQMAYWPGNSSDPHISYYRLQTKKNLRMFSANAGYEELFVECLVPMVLPQDLNKERVHFYQEQFRQGIVPTAFSVAIWDNKAPACSFDEDHPHYDPDVAEHQLLTHYIIDGHHKVYAAALENKEITLLTYIRKDNYFGIHVKQEQIDSLAKPSKKHDRDIWLETLKDSKADLENRLKAIELLTPYVSFHKVQDLMMKIVTLFENEELVRAAEMMLAQHWGKIYMPKEKKEQLFNTLRPSAQEIAKKFLW